MEQVRSIAASRIFNDTMTSELNLKVGTYYLPKWGLPIKLNRLLTLIKPLFLKSKIRISATDNCHGCFVLEPKFFDALRASLIRRFALRCEYSRDVLARSKAQNAGQNSSQNPFEFVAPAETEQIYIPSPPKPLRTISNRSQLVNGVADIFVKFKYFRSSEKKFLEIPQKATTPVLMVSNTSLHKVNLKSKKARPSTFSPKYLMNGWLKKKKSGSQRVHQ